MLGFEDITVKVCHPPRGLKSVWISHVFWERVEYSSKIICKRKFRFELQIYHLLAM